MLQLGSFCQANNIFSVTLIYYMRQILGQSPDSADSVTHLGIVSLELNSPNINTMVLMRGMSPAATPPGSPWELKSVTLGPGGQSMVWEFMVRVSADRNISMLDVYSRALRPALSIKSAAVATEKRRITPTSAASYLPDMSAGQGQRLERPPNKRRLHQ